MNIILHELRIHLKSIIIWSISIALFIMMSMVKFDATSGTGADFIKLIESMPKALQVMIGGGYFDLLLPIGFFGATFLYIMFLGAIHGSMLGASILAKEERDKTTEFLLVKPKGEANLQEVIPFFENTKKSYPEAFSGKFFSDYIEFLISWELVGNVGDEYSITANGKAFIAYITAMKFNKNKAL